MHYRRHRRAIIHHPADDDFIRHRHAIILLTTSEEQIRILAKLAISGAKVNIFTVGTYVIYSTCLLVLKCSGFLRTQQVLLAHLFQYLIIVTNYFSVKVRHDRDFYHLLYCF